MFKTIQFEMLVDEFYTDLLGRFSELEQKKIQCKIGNHNNRPAFCVKYERIDYTKIYLFTNNNPYHLLQNLERFLKSTYNKNNQLDIIANKFMDMNDRNNLILYFEEGNRLTCELL
jgi:hypothetical protein